MKTSSILTAILALVVSVGIAARDDGARAEPSAIPSPNGDAEEMACRHQNIFAITCPDDDSVWECAAGCPTCALSCSAATTACNNYCSAACFNAGVIGNC